MCWHLSLQDSLIEGFSSVQQLSHIQLFVTPLNRSTLGLPVHHQLPEFTQTHIHRVSDAIQPSHPLLSPSPPAPTPPSIRVFSNESTLHIRWPKQWSLLLLKCATFILNPIRIGYHLFIKQYDLIKYHKANFEG